MTAYFEALVELFEELSFFLEGLRPRLQETSFGPGTASRTIAISILSHLTIICFRALKLLSRNTWLARLGMFYRYFKVILTQSTVCRRLSQGTHKGQ